MPEIDLSAAYEDLTLPAPNYPPKFDFVDPDCKAIAQYLYDSINEVFSTTGVQMVKTYRTWNDIQIPTVDYPVLKVYASAEALFQNAPYLSTQFTIAYGLAYTTKPKVGDVSRFVTKEILRSLVNGPLDDSQFQFQLDWDTPPRVEYETLISPDNVIYRYCTITCNIFTRIDEI